MSTQRVTTVIIGGGHCGLAMSHCLSGLGVDHVILERGNIANTWRTERWDSLRLLTPNWLCRLPGHAYDGDRPDGFMTMPEVIAFLEDYAERESAPVETETEVTMVQRSGEEYLVKTNRGEWACKALVIASGSFSIPKLPAISSALPSRLDTIDCSQYRNPGQLADGNVLVVGASATGLQLAREIQASGRHVTLAVGEHVRLPRSYRGKDILWWLDVTGRSDEHYKAVDDLLRARRVPSPQLIGTEDGKTVDLNTLTESGVRIVGRFCGVTDTHFQFSGSLRNCCALADLKMGRLLREIDAWINTREMDSSFPPEPAPEPTRVPEQPPTTLAHADFSTVVWATGYRPDYSWLDVPVLDSRGALIHDGGVVDSPGLYAMGLPFMRRRKSTFIHGAENDARDISAHLFAYLRQKEWRVAV